MRLQAKRGYEVTVAEIERERKARGPHETILDRDRTFWMKFLKDGDLDTEAILARNYKPAQLAFIKSEFKRLKWLPQ